MCFMVSYLALSDLVMHAENTPLHIGITSSSVLLAKSCIFPIGHSNHFVEIVFKTLHNICSQSEDAFCSYIWRPVALVISPTVLLSVVGKMAKSCLDIVVSVVNISSRTI